VQLCTDIWEHSLHHTTRNPGQVTHSNKTPYFDKWKATPSPGACIGSVLNTPEHSYVCAAQHKTSQRSKARDTLVHEGSMCLSCTQTLQHSLRYCAQSYGKNIRQVKEVHILHATLHATRESDRSTLSRPVHTTKSILAVIDLNARVIDSCTNECLSW
jgi:hypothetical protein